MQTWTVSFIRTWTISFFISLVILISALFAQADETQGLSRFDQNPYVQVAANSNRSQALDDKSEFNINSKTEAGLPAGLACQDFEYLKGVCYSVKSFIELQEIE